MLFVYLHWYFLVFYYWHGVCCHSYPVCSCFILRWFSADIIVYNCIALLLVDWYFYSIILLFFTFQVPLKEGPWMQSQALLFHDFSCNFLSVLPIPFINPKLFSGPVSGFFFFFSLLSMLLLNPRFIKGQNVFSNNVFCWRLTIASPQDWDSAAAVAAGTLYRTYIL